MTTKIRENTAVIMENTALIMENTAVIMENTAIIMENTNKKKMYVKVGTVSTVLINELVAAVSSNSN